ncbi:heme-binding protein [Nocardioides sp.]|uniref:GlcG/HbpS family heme-binding protein n=1 Tax=Nocardioides sp. TaxID=35761 RepID=UPI0026326C9C|nr:heme-binding protein [Nocardioides sp.]
MADATTPALARAQRIADAVLDAAREAGCAVSVVVVDEHADPLLLIRSGARWFTADVARAKAATAARMGAPTEALGAMRTTYPDLWEQLVRRLPEATTLGGGLPLHVDGDLVGAVGVSGGTVEQDIAFASAGVAVAG